MLEKEIRPLSCEMIWRVAAEIDRLVVIRNRFRLGPCLRCTRDMHRRGALLKGVRQLVGKQSFAALGLRRVVACAENNVVSDCECSCIHGTRKRVRVCVVVDADGGEVRVEPRLHERTHRGR
jgi:hypothetical protein